MSKSGSHKVYLVDSSVKTGLEVKAYRFGGKGRNTIDCGFFRKKGRNKP